MATLRAECASGWCELIEALEARIVLNAPPAAPVILEPASEGKVVSGYDVHMEIDAFSDPDLGQARLNTDWEIWTAGAGPVRVWSALAATGVDDHHIHLGDGTFEGPLAGKSALDSNLDYQLRVRQRDNSGDVSTNTGPYSLRTFHTLPTELPTAAGWVAQQSGYRVEELPFIFPTGELQFRLPTNIAFVPESVHDHHPDAPFFYVMELYGSIRVVTNNFTVRTYATSLLNYNPNGPFGGSGENGSAGLVVDPASGDLFATMLYDDLTDGTSNTFPKITRFHSTNGGISAATATDILKMPGEPMRQSHFISNISFGPSDGKLYVHIGDGFDSTASRNLQYFRGKIIRLNTDGSPLTDNPFYDPADRGSDGRPDSEDYVWALGYRNPFGGAWRDADGSHYVVENGPSRDRFSRLVRARDYLFDGTDESMNNYNIAYSPSGSFENGADDWNPAPAPVNVAFIQQSTGNYSGFPVDKWGHAFVALSGPTHAPGPNFAKSIQEWVLNPDGTRRVSASGEPANPRELASYEGSGYSTAAGIAAGPDGLYFTTLYPETDSNPTATGARILRIVYTGTGIATSPSSLYNFDETSGATVIDSGTAANNGTLINGAARVAGVSGNAVQFDGVNDSISVTRDMSTVLGGTATLAAWLRTTQTGNVDMWLSPGITGAEDSGGDNDVFWGWIDNTGRIGVMAGDDPGAKSTNPVDDGQWHHVAFTRDAASGVVQVYVDGVFNGSAASATGQRSTPFNSIGKIVDTSGADDYLSGTLDDLRIFGRVLSATEIQALMTQQPPPPPPANNPPTVAASASATPDAADNRKVTLSVLGADDGGESNLTYTWSTLAKPTGATDPVFSTNSTNAARNVSVTLARAGGYTFRVAIRDAQGASVTSDVSINVASAISSVTVTPATAALVNGQTQQFTATARDQFGDVLSPQPAFTWSLATGSVGSVSTTGLYTAPASGTGLATVRATAGAVAGTAAVTVTAPATDVTSGLVSRWRFDEGVGTTAADSAGTNTGTLTNGPVWTTGRIGASAVTFDGVNDYVRTTTALQSVLGGTATLSAWIKTTQVGNSRSSRSPGIAGVDQATGTNDVVWGWIDNNGRIGVMAGDTAGAKSTNRINDGLWHHVAFTRNAATGVVQVYVDGTLNSTATSATGARTTAFSSIGRIEDTSGAIDYLAGSLDEVRLYNRVLTAQEVLTVKNVTVPVPPPPPTTSTYVSDLPYQPVTNGWGPVEKDMSNGEEFAGDGQTQRLNGVTYAKGLGVHASSEVIVNLGGQYTTFLSDVGIDDESGSAGSVVFQVFLDDVKVYDSGVMTGSTATRSISIDVTSHNVMQLVVTNGGNNIDDDHADWAGARLLAPSTTTTTATATSSLSLATSTTTLASSTTIATTTNKSLSTGQAIKAPPTTAKPTSTAKPSTPQKTAKTPPFYAQLPLAPTFVATANLKRLNEVLVRIPT